MIVLTEIQIDPMSRPSVPVPAFRKKASGVPKPARRDLKHLWQAGRCDLHHTTFFIQAEEALGPIIDLTSLIVYSPT